MSPKKTKAFVLHRAGGMCEYCKSPANISSQPFVLEHIIPTSKGGVMNVENLALSCQGCNNHKYTKTTWHDPLTGEEVNLFNPRLQEWNDNFTWSADVTEILGTTVVGRATVEALKMNRPALQNLRSLLAEAGRHPPR